MDARQKLIDWDKRNRDLAVLQSHLELVCDEDSDTSLLLSLAREDNSRGEMTETRKSKAELGVAAGVSRNTSVAALRRLQRLGVLEYEVIDDRHAIVVDWIAVWRLVPKEHGEERIRKRMIARREAAGQGVVRAGQGTPRGSITNKTRVDRGFRVDPGSVFRGVDPRLVRPWHSRDGLRTEELVRAVERRDKATLLALYWAGVRQSPPWWGDCEDHRNTFLACCWQAVQSYDSSAMGLLHTLVRRWLRAAEPGEERQGLTGQADDWARETRLQWRRASADGADPDRQLVERVAVCD